METVGYIPEEEKQKQSGKPTKPRTSPPPKKPTPTEPTITDNPTDRKGPKDGNKTAGTE